MATGTPPRMLGRYALYGEIAAGGMASVHLGRLLGQAGFSRTVAIKRLHAQFAKDADFRAMFLDEARLAARVRHPNALPALDVIEEDGELYIVMDYIHGEALAKLLKLGPAPLPIVSAILTQVLLGLHAAHETLDEAGAPLNIVHRDVSPQNILVGVDGVARVMDFGIAKATTRIHTTDAGKVKGKLAYMSPEQLSGHEVDRRTDIFAAGVVLWEASTGHKLLSRGEATIPRVMNWQGLSAEEAAQAPEPVRDIARRALSRRPEDRFANAKEMATALSSVVAPASALAVGEWVDSQARSVLLHRLQVVQDIERGLTESEVRSRPQPLSSPTVPQHPAARSRAGGLGRSRVLPFIAAGLGLLALGLAVHQRGEEPAEQPLSFSVRPVPPPPVAIDAVPLGPPIVELAELPLATDIASAPVASAPAAPAATVPHKTSARVPATALLAPTKVAAPSAKSDCNPPYVLGPNGVKRFKSQCLK